VIPAGTSVAIKANARYSFTSPGALEFLNYRRDASYITVPGMAPWLETAAEGKGPRRSGID